MKANFHFQLISHSEKSPSPGFKPIQNGEINFLDITNKGLMPGVNPNGKAMDFWMNIEKRMQKYIKVKRYGKPIRKRDLLLSCLGFNYDYVSDDEWK